MHRFIKWRASLQVAQNAEAVGDLMRAYVSALPAQEVAALPQTCQQALSDPDIPGAAIALLQCELGHKGSPEELALLHEIAHTFAAASIRLGQLEGGLSAASD